MSDIEAKLEEARSRAHNYGQLYGAWDSSKDTLSLVYAKLEVNAKGETVGERDAWVKRQLTYIDAVMNKKNAAADWKEAEVWMKLLMLEAECWRTTQANNRYIDRAHE